MVEILLSLVIALALYVAYLEFQLSLTSRQSIVVMPSTTDQGSGIGCAAIALLVLLIVIALALLGVLPPLR